MNLTNDIILIDKPQDWTSNDVVQKIKKSCGYKKVGHAGTLDPMATGLLVIGINEGTKKLNNFLHQNKQYITTIVFGKQTLTGDCTSQVTHIASSMINLKQIEQALQWFISNNYYQIPHKFSAIKINGKKAYEYARQNISIMLPSRLVKINEYKIINYDEKKQELLIKITVSKGFYVRSFAQDLAKKLDTYGHITSLRRLMIGNLSINNAITLEKYLQTYGKNK